MISTIIYLQDGFLIGEPNRAPRLDANGYASIPFYASHAHSDGCFTLHGTRADFERFVEAIQVKWRMLDAAAPAPDASQQESGANPPTDQKP